MLFGLFGHSLRGETNSDIELVVVERLRVGGGVGVVYRKTSWGALGVSRGLKFFFFS